MQHEQLLLNIENQGKILENNPQKNSQLVSKNTPTPLLGYTSLINM